MSKDLMNLSAFENARPAQAFQALNPSDDNLSEGIGQSYGVVGYKGKVWSLRHRGQHYTFTRPDDGSPSNYIDVVILRQGRGKSKSYYPSYDQEQSEGARPICASINGITPDLDVQQKQAEACAICPRNAWHKDASGRNTRECTDYKRLAVLFLPYQTARIMNNVPLLEPVFLRVPPASLNDLATMGDTMTAKGWHFSTYITRISFDPTQSFPKMTFTPLQGLSDAEAAAVLPLREDSMALRITGEAQVDANVSQPRALPPGAANVQPALSAPAAQAPVPPPPVSQPPVAPPTAAPVPPPPPPAPAPVNSGLGAPAGNPQVMEATPTAASPASSGIASGLLELTANQPPPASPPPAATVNQPPPATPPQQATGQTAADVGEAIPSDAGLDAAVAELLKTK